MSSDDTPDPDLPVALTVEKQGALVSYRYSGLVDLEDEGELVRKSDAEEDIAEARKREKQRILDKIDKRIKQVDRLGEKYGSEMNADMIKNELEELRDELKQEVFNE